MNNVAFIIFGIKQNQGVWILPHEFRDGCILQDESLLHIHGASVMREGQAANRQKETGQNQTIWPLALHSNPHNSFDPENMRSHSFLSIALRPAR
jgi:hypothetical protein